VEAAVKARLQMEAELLALKDANASYREQVRGVVLLGACLALPQTMFRKHHLKLVVDFPHALPAG
jgi:hypothetical protein